MTTQREPDTSAPPSAPLIPTLYNALAHLLDLYDREVAPTPEHAVALDAARQVLALADAAGQAAPVPPPVIITPVAGWPEPRAADMPSAYVSVPPPASANAGTGRATGEELIEALLDAANDLERAQQGAEHRYTRKTYLAAKQALIAFITSEHQRGLAEGERSEREAVAAWMMKQGFATGHGDTTADLLAEMEWQIAERVSRSERIGIEKAAKALEGGSGFMTPSEYLRHLALTPGGKTAEVDPNAWAFKHGLEST